MKQKKKAKPNGSLPYIDPRLTGYQVDTTAEPHFINRHYPHQISNRSFFYKLRFKDLTYTHQIKDKLTIKLKK